MPMLKKLGLLGLSIVVLNLTFTAAVKSANNKGKWGSDDQIGTLNYITPQVRTNAAKLVRSGKVFNLAIDLKKNTPSYPGRVYQHSFSLILPGLASDGGGIGLSDDLIIMHQQYSERLDTQLAAVRYKQGKLIGRMEAIGFSLRNQASLHTLTLDVLKSSEIEGEILDKEQVRSSIARRLGMDIGALTPASRNIEGVVEMMLDATQNYDKPLTKERLFSWHASLFPTGYSGMRKIKVADWRDDTSEPMQVVSGPIGREHVHFEAPPADQLEKEMTTFLDWFNIDDGTDLVLRACIAHLWFVTMHPFEDGNGRIARAIVDMTLARSEQSAQRFYSMSAQIRQERDAYYRGLETTQKESLDITKHLEWFLDCLSRAFDNVDETLAAVFKKVRFWESCVALPFNERQRLILNKLLDGFEGKLTSSKWAKLAKCSQDTALRDIQDLVERDILAKDPAGGRSTSYSLIEGA